ncbi:Cell division control protein 42 [Mycena sanguinolenta]|uniref:Cell division control protein 42 n=1 Tax=Mycena sanguinolenta TaxID=230812 RepID=A0A8H6XX06_9AGAR|nr:Cell division control protein 42 [Mycena sanguinolenta]
MARPAYSLHTQKNIFPTGYVSRTYGGHGIEVVVRDVRYLLQVFDNAGAPEHDRLRPLGYPYTSVFVICFSVDIPTSFFNVRSRWLPDAQHHCPGIPRVLVATQIDLREPEFDADALGVEPEAPRLIITTAEGEKLAREIKAAKYVECSAKTREGVQDVFDEAMIAAVDYQQLYHSTKRQVKCVVL